MIPLKQEQRRQQTIQLLLDSTKELISEMGCNAITLKDIMERTGLSKGAIFHYIQSKDEIFAWVLRNQLEQTNEQFFIEVEHGDKSFDGPMSKITDRLLQLEDPEDVTNKAFIYLLGKDNDPVIAETLQHFYNLSVELSKQWILAGQQHGVILDSIDTDQVSEMFVLLSIGLRVRSSLPQVPVSFGAQDLSSFMSQILKK